MRDGAKLARRGIPAVALVTQNFIEQGNFIARSVGLPDLPRVRLPHPVAGTGEENLRRVAEEVAPLVVRAWKGAE